MNFIFSSVSFHRRAPNMKRYVALCLVLLMLSLLFCSCKESSKTILENESENILDNETENTLGSQTEERADYPDHLEERTAWNIELKLLKIDDKGIWITICDYDNQGFEYNSLYYVLERYENGEWIKTKIKAAPTPERVCKCLISHTV